ncbi:hypothetical protein F8M41_021476 [Gigaspora margarita]|uniref:Uncharacterized protein n=1 Tax=Gigaspora margarita TaxID=4874 RepID=A0A8H4ETN8_GIGMA|nr:hypothetical protein F8M41_021476 [Gigaspora margarita]
MYTSEVTLLLEVTRELEAHRGHRNRNTLFGFHKKHYILVYCSTNVNKKLKVYDIEQFLEIVDMLPQDNTVCIHMISGPSVSRELLL